MPVQRMSFLTPSGFCAAGPSSGTRRLNSLLGSISSKEDLHSGRRRSDFGVMMTNGLRNGNAIWIGHSLHFFIYSRTNKSWLLQGVPSACGPGLGLTLIWVLTVLPSCPATSAKFTSAQAELGRQWNTQIQVNPTYRYTSTLYNCISLKWQRSQ